MLSISSSSKDEIAKLSNAYANQIFAPYTIGDQIMRRSPFRLRAILSIVPPQEISALVKPLKIAAFVHTFFLSASVLFMLVFAFTN